MVLPAPPAHASPVEPPWFDKLVVAIELSAGGVLTLVDNAAPARLREAYLRLRARDPATGVIVDVRRLAELPPGSTVILALSPSISNDDLDWLNLNRPVVSDRRLSVVLWCEDGAATALARRAPDFFDWISARVDCPPAPAAHAVADVKRAICARASGIAWDGPGLEETLAAVRPGRPVRRVAVASYQSMIDALTSREQGWLFLEGVDTDFHLRRLRWAMAESGRRVIVLRRAIGPIAPGWWTVHARHESVVEAVHALIAAGGSGRLAALVGLDPDACAYARFALHRGIEVAHLEDLLATAPEPRTALQDLARRSGWPAADVLIDVPWRRYEAARHAKDDDPNVLALRRHSSLPKPWLALGIDAWNASDFEIAIRWLTKALDSVSSSASPEDMVHLYVQRGRAHRRAGNLVSARADLEQADSLAQGIGATWARVQSAASLAGAFLELGESLRAREYLEPALSASADLGDRVETAVLLDLLAWALVMQGDLAEPRRHLERALSIKQRLALEDQSFIAVTLDLLGQVLAAQGDLEGARSYLERSLEIAERTRGPEHPSVVGELRLLANLYQKLGNTSGARALLRRALAIQRVALGSEEHPDIADTLTALARVTAAGGDLDEAQAMLESALATQQRVFGNDGKLAGATTRRALADVRVAKGDLAGAIEQLERALATLRTIFERDDHPEIAATLRELERLQGLQRELQAP